MRYLCIIDLRRLEEGGRKEYKSMNIEEVREFALTLPHVEEALFAENWINFRIGGKWFMLIQLDAPEPRIAVKCDPDLALDLRSRYDGVEPAYHMNKRMWNDIYLQRDLDDEEIKKWVLHSYHEVMKKLPKSKQKDIIMNNH